MQEPHNLSDERPVQFPNWDLIDGRDGVHYMSILGRLAHNEQTCAPVNSDPESLENRLGKDNEGQTNNPGSQIMRFAAADKEYLEQRGAFTLPPKCCW